MNPLMVGVGVLNVGSLGKFKILATWTGEPLLAPLVVTTAVRLPPELGGVVKFILNWVAVALATEPTAPLLKVTELLAAVVSNPVPAMVIVLVLINRLVVLVVTVGIAVRVTSFPVPPI